MRGDLTDEEWAIIGGLLPAERGGWARPAQDNRRFLDGMLYVLRAGCPWRDMHERYGKWNSVYVRFRRWAEQGVWDALLETLVELGLAQALDPPPQPALRAHPHAPQHPKPTRILARSRMGVADDQESHWV